MSFRATPESYAEVGGDPPRPLANPFSSRRVRPGVIPFQFPPGLDAAELAARFARLGSRGAIIGPHGTGKSTLLAALVPELGRAGYAVRAITLRDGQCCLPRAFFPTIESAPPWGTAQRRRVIVVVDGYEQLTYRNRWRLRRRCRALGAGLLVTAHRATTLPLLFRTAADLELSQRIVEHLLAASDPASEGATPTAPPIAREEVRRAWLQHRGNLRETLFELYDAFERRRSEGLEPEC